MHAQRLLGKRLRPRRRTSCKLICAAFAAIAISGCAKAPEGTLAQVCGPNGWREIGVRKADVITPDTAKEIIGNNEARQAWCTPKKA
jgi:hypothetical protein